MKTSQQQAWRVGHRGRDAMYYEEMIDGAWQRIELDGEMLMGRAHHVIYFASAEQWQCYPVWARHRRNEIIARIKSEFREPDYAYQMETESIPQTSSGTAVPATFPHALPTKDIVTAKQHAAMWTVILILVAITSTMGWLVLRGIERGETVMPSKHASLQRTLTRKQEPASFWGALSVYTLIGFSTGAGSLWFIRLTWRMK
jgi:hypothetical protein